MPRSANTHWVSDIKGYSDTVVPGDAPQVTDSMTNTKARFGRIEGRGGMTKYQAVSTPSTEDIIGLFNYRRVSGTHELLRLLLTKVEKFSGGVWTDVTGTALTGTSTLRPDFTIIDDTLVFTNGKDRPRKYAGSGTTASIAAGTSPFSKNIESYLGFLFLGNASLDGTFTDVVDGARTAFFSDDWDNDWTQCAGNFIVLDETPGELISMKVLGRTMFAIKSDGVVSVRFTGGATRFQQDLISSDVGFVSGLSVKKIGEKGILGLGNDGIIYAITLQGVEPVSYEALHKILPDTLPLNRLQFARGLVDSEEDTYYLFYDRSGLSNQLLNSYVSYNYRTREFQKGELGKNIIAAVEFKDTDAKPEQLLLSTTTLVEEFDNGADDDGVAITRTWTTGWQKFNETGWLHGLWAIFKRSSSARVKIDVALDHENTFHNAQVFSLAGGSPSDEHTEVEYHLPQPVFAEFINVRLRYFHDKAAAKTKLERIGFEVRPTLRTGEKTSRSTENLVG